MNPPARSPADRHPGLRRSRRPGPAARSNRAIALKRDLLGLKRVATATAEVAICLPVLLTLTLATVDLCSVFFLKETVAIAAYEGARRGINRGGTDAAAIARARQVLSERGIDIGADGISFDGVTFDDAETLEHVTFIVSVPAAGNLVAPAGLYGDLTLTARVTMRKEFQNQE